MKFFYRSIVEIAAEKKETVVGWIDYKTIERIVGAGNRIGYTDLSIEYGVKSQYIIPRDEANLNEINNENGFTQESKNRSNRKDREVKFVDALPIQGEVRIIGDYIAISTGIDTPIGVLVHDKLMASLFLSIFHSAWNQG